MNRRELAKIVAATAAGSVAGKSTMSITEEDLSRLWGAGWDAGHAKGRFTDPEMLQVMRDALAQIPEPSPETEAHLERCRQRFDEATRLQSAIELGDRTAGEFGDCYFEILRDGNQKWHVSLGQGMDTPSPSRQGSSPARFPRQPWAALSPGGNGDHG